MGDKASFSIDGARQCFDIRREKWLTGFNEPFADRDNVNLNQNKGVQNVY